MCGDEGDLPKKRMIDKIRKSKSDAKERNSSRKGSNENNQSISYNFNS